MCFPPSKMDATGEAGQLLSINQHALRCILNVSAIFLISPVSASNHQLQCEATGLAQLPDNCNDPVKGTCQQVHSCQQRGKQQGTSKV